MLGPSGVFFDHQDAVIGCAESRGGNEARKAASQYNDLPATRPESGGIGDAAQFRHQPCDRLPGSMSRAGSSASFRSTVPIT